MKKQLSGWAVKRLSARIFLLSLICLSAQLLNRFSSWAGNSAKGTSAANFLKITPGARAAALGGGMVGAADDAGSLFDNPAGLARLAQPQLSVSHLSYFQSINFNYLGFALPLASKTQALGFSITSLGVDNIEKRSGDTDVADGKFEAADYAYQLSYGRNMSKGVSAGASIKGIRERIDTVTASALAVDLGVHWARSESVWRGFGVSVRQIGQKMKFSNVSDPLPLVISAGANARILGDHLNIVVDANAPRDRDPYMSFGGEFSFMAGQKLGLAARAGYSGFLQKVDGRHNLSLGFGLSLDPMSFDFAWVPYGDLGNTFRYSLLVRF